MTGLYITNRHRAVQYDLDEQYNRRCVLPSLRNYKTVQYDHEQYNRHCLLHSLQNYKTVQYDLDEQYNRHCVLPSLQNDRTVQYDLMTSK